MKKTNEFIKKRIILSKYYFRAISKWFFSSLAMILFLFSAVLFIWNFFPNFINRIEYSWLTNFVVWDLELEGKLYRQVDSDDSQKLLQPISYARIEIGGFQTTTDLNGYFSLKFKTQKKTDIPITIYRNSIYSLFTITYPENEKKIYEDIILENE